MFISHITIKGFRSLGEVDSSLQDYTCLIGKNDCGKSSFLIALQILFDPTKTPSSEDICKIPDYGNECFIEATLKECNGHGDLIINGEIRIRRTFLERASSWLYLGKVPSSETLANMSEGNLTKQDFNSDTFLSQQVKDFVNDDIQKKFPSGRIPKEIWKEIFENLKVKGLVEFKEGWCSLDSGRLSSLVQVVMLEADVRGEEEVSDSSQTVFSRVGGLILREATKNHAGITTAISNLTQEIQKVSTKNEQDEWIISELNHFESLFNDEIKSFDGDVTAHSSLIPPRVPPFDFSVKIEISDKWITGIGKMGHGLRRSVVFSMLRVHRRLKEQVSSDTEPLSTDFSPLYLFLVEEPELYLHPQAERRRMRELQELSRLPNAQVILCTHSAIFADLSEYKGILRLHRQDRGVTSIQGWQGRELEPDDKRTMKLLNLIDANRAAMLFADLVILVEGQCEKVAIPFLAEKMGIDITNTEIVDCGGNGSIPTCQQVLEGFGIKYVAWLDLDEGNKNEREIVQKAKNICTPSNGRIVITPGNWEKFNGLGGDKIYSSWKHFIQDENPPSEQMVARIKAAYNWQEYLTDPVGTNAS